MIKNKTQLQMEIIDVIRGHTMAEVIHAFEVIKLDALLNDGNLNTPIKKKEIAK